MVRTLFCPAHPVPLGLRHPLVADLPQGRCGRACSAGQLEFHRYGDQLNGFDRTVSPPWQMVPLGGQRTVIVTFHGPEADARRYDLYCHSDVAGIFCRRKRNRILVDVYGEGPFLTDLLVRHLPTQTIAGRMELSVKQRRTYRVLFIELRVEGQPQSDRFRFGKSPNVAELLKRVNQEILLPQVNIKFELAAPLAQPMNLDESTVITDDIRRRRDRRTISDDERRGVQQRAERLIVQRGADLGVIFVHELREKNFSGSFTNGVRLGDTVFLTDDLIDETATLAHELSHWLLRGLGDFIYPDPGSSNQRHNHSESVRDLMYPTINGGTRGRRIRRREADVMNETGMARR